MKCHCSWIAFYQYGAKWFRRNHSLILVLCEVGTPLGPFRDEESGTDLLEIG